MKLSTVTSDENGALTGLPKDQKFVLVQVSNNAQLKTNLQPASRIGASGSRHVLSVTEIIPDSPPAEAAPAPTQIPNPVREVEEHDETPH